MHRKKRMKCIMVGRREGGGGVWIRSRRCTRRKVEEEGGLEIRGRGVGEWGEVE